MQIYERALLITLKIVELEPDRDEFNTDGKIDPVKIHKYAENVSNNIAQSEKAHLKKVTAGKRPSGL